MFKKSIKNYISLFLVTFLTLTLMSGCSNQTENQEKEENGTLQITLSGGQESSPSGNIESDSLQIQSGKTLYLTLTNQATRATLTKRLSLIQFNSSLITEEVSIPVGDYLIEGVLVLTGTGNVTHATPKRGSQNQFLVRRALPIPIRIQKDAVESTEIEVVPIQQANPSEFGYRSFQIEVVSTITAKISLRLPEICLGYVPEKVNEHYSLEIYSEDQQRGVWQEIYTNSGEYKVTVPGGPSSNYQLRLRTRYTKQQITTKNIQLANYQQAPLNLIQSSSLVPFTFIGTISDISLIPRTISTGNRIIESGNFVILKVIGENDNLRYIVVENENQIAKPNFSILDFKIGQTIASQVEYCSSFGNGIQIKEAIGQPLKRIPILDEGTLRISTQNNYTIEPKKSKKSKIVYQVDFVGVSNIPSPNTNVIFKGLTNYTGPQAATKLPLVPITVTRIEAR